MKSKLMTFILCCFFLNGCTSRLIDFTIISTKNIDLSKSSMYQVGKTKIKGTDLSHWIIIIPTKVKITPQEAIDKAIESTPGCVALLNGIVYRKFWYIPCIYGQQSYVIEGIPLIDPDLVNNANNVPTYKKIETFK
jgi:hypothetical protein